MAAEQHSSSFKKGVQDALQILHRYEINQTEFYSFLHEIKECLVNNINATRILKLILHHTYRSPRQYYYVNEVERPTHSEKSLLDQISETDGCVDGQSLTLLLNNYYHPLFILPQYDYNKTNFKYYYYKYNDYNSKREPTYISLRFIGNEIQRYRSSYKLGNSVAEKEKFEEELTENISKYIEYINKYPSNYIEIVDNENPLKLKKVCLIKQRPSLITICFNKSLDNKYIIQSLFVLGLINQMGVGNMFKNCLPPPQCLYKLFSAGIDIIHFYDIENKLMIDDNKEKKKLISIFYNNPETNYIYNYIIPFFLVSTKFRDPFIAAYNNLHEFTELDDEMIRMIISFAWNEYKFEDISYIQFDIELMNVICDYSLISLPFMTQIWRNWIMRKICLLFNNQQNKYLKDHMINNQNTWNNLILELDILDFENWAYLAGKCGECEMNTPSKKIFNAIKLYLNIDDNGKNIDLVFGKEYNLKFDPIEVLIKIKLCGEYPLGLFWYFVSNLNVDENTQHYNIWKSFNQYLLSLYCTDYTLWHSLCIDHFLSGLFFKFYGSLKNDKKLLCFKNTIKLLKIWNNKQNISNIQNVYLVQCFNSCNIEIFEALIKEDILNINELNKESITKLFEAFKLKFPYIQQRRYNTMLVISKWLFRNNYGESLNIICNGLIKEIDNKWGNEKPGKWKNVIKTLNKLQSEWTESIQ